MRFAFSMASCAGLPRGLLIFAGLVFAILVFVALVFAVLVFAGMLVSSVVLLGSGCVEAGSLTFFVAPTAFLMALIAAVFVAKRLVSLPVSRLNSATSSGIDISCSSLLITSSSARAAR